MIGSDNLSSAASRPVFGIFPLLLIVFGVICIICICISYFAARRMESIARMKGYTGPVFAWCFWLPPIGYAMVRALPDRGNAAGNDDFPK